MSAELRIAQDVLNKVADGYSKVVELTGDELAKQLDFEAPRKTARLAGSMESKKTGRFSSVAGSDVKYAIPVMEKVVRNPGSSRKPSVGTKGNPYADRAIENTRGKAEDIISFALTSVGL